MGKNGKNKKRNRDEDLRIRIRQRQAKDYAQDDKMKNKMKKKKYELRHFRKDMMNVRVKNRSGMDVFFSLYVEPRWSRKKLRRKIRAKVHNLKMPCLGQIKVKIYEKEMTRQESVKDFWRPMAPVEVQFIPWDVFLKIEENDNSRIRADSNIYDKQYCANCKIIEPTFTHNCLHCFMPITVLA